MKFLLVGINAKYIHSNPAIASLRSYAGEAFADCTECVEYTINNLREDILSGIYGHQPDYIGLSVYIWNVAIIRNLLSDIGRVLPKTKIFLGGPEVSFNPEEYLLHYPNVAGVMIGEGEATFRELLQRIADFGLNFDNIKGLYTRSGFGGERELLDGDDIPFIYSDQNINDYNNRIIYYETSRGCPFRCSYCLSSIDKSVRFKGLKKVFGELDFFLRHRVTQVKFVDRTFNCNPERAMEIWRYVKENDNGVTNFHFEVEADLLGEEAIELLSDLRPGLVQLEMGVQSTNPKTLEAINRKQDISYTKEVVGRLMRGENINIHLDLIAGLPYEDLRSFRKSFDDIFALRPHQLQLGFLKVLKGVLMESEVSQYGIEYSDNPPFEVLGTNWISYRDILELKKVERMVEMYYNSGQFTNAIEMFAQDFDSAYMMFAYMADYYDRYGLFVNNPKRAARYEIMLDMYKEIHDSGRGDGDASESCDEALRDERNCDEGSDDEALRDALTLDFYIREKPKAKPDFVHRIPEGLKVDYEKRNPVTGNCYWEMAVSVGENE